MNSPTYVCEMNNENKLHFVYFLPEIQYHNQYFNWILIRKSVLYKFVTVFHVKVNSVLIDDERIKW